MRQVGMSYKVTAVDAVTGDEVSFIAPLSATESMIKKLAADKMRYVAAKSTSVRPVQHTDSDIIV